MRVWSDMTPDLHPFVCAQLFLSQTYDAASKGMAAAEWQRQAIAHESSSTGFVGWATLPQRFNLIGGLWLQLQQAQAGQRLFEQIGTAEGKDYGFVRFSRHIFYSRHLSMCGMWREEPVLIAVLHQWANLFVDGDPVGHLVHFFAVPVEQIATNAQRTQHGDVTAICHGEESSSLVRDPGHHHTCWQHQRAAFLNEEARLWMGIIAGPDLIGAA